MAYNPQTGITERIGDNCSHPGSLYCSGEERFSASYQRIDSANTTFTTLANNTQVSAVLVTQLAQLQGTTPKDISQALYWFGSGKMASPRNSFNNIWDKKTAKSQFTNLESGSLARLAPYKHQNYFNTDEQISQRLCEILAGIKPDITIAYMAPDGTYFPEDSSSGFAKRIPNSKKGQGDVDRYNASVQSPVTVMASYLACYDPPLVSNCGRFGINLTPDVCNNTPALFKRGGIAGNEPMLYDSTNGLWFYLRMAFGLENASSKGFFEQCIQQDELVNCESKDAKTVTDWFGGLKQDIRDDIITTFSGVYNILGVNGCLRCVVSTFYLPNTSSAAQQISLTAKTVSPYKYHQQMDQMANLEINLPANPKLSLYSSDTKVPLGQAFEQIDYRTKEPLWLKIVQTIKKVFNIGQCQPEQVTVEVNGQPVTASVCKGSGAALVYSRVYLDKSFQQQSVYTAQTVKQMLPHSVNQQISQALQDEGADALYNKFSIKSSVTSGGGGSPQDLIRQGQASVDETDLPQKDGIFGKNTSFEQQVLFNQVLPYAWQQNL